MLRLHALRLIKSVRYSSGNDWEFIQPYPTSKENPGYGFPTIPIPPPLPRKNESMDAMRARLVWVSRKRGILETDLLLGTYFGKYKDSLTLQELKDYDQLLDENDWDIYYWATGARNVPDKIAALSIWPQLFEHCKNRARVMLKMPEL